MEASQFKSLFLPCHHKLYAVAWRLTGNSQAAEDLVQETYLRLWTKRHQIADIENAEAYSISVLRRQFYDVKRANRIQEAAIGHRSNGSRSINGNPPAVRSCRRMRAHKADDRPTS